MDVKVIKHKSRSTTHRHRRKYYDSQITVRTSRALISGSAHAWVFYKEKNAFDVDPDPSLNWDREELDILIIQGIFKLKFFKLKIENLYNSEEECVWRHHINNFEKINKKIYRILGITIPQIHTLMQNINCYDLYGINRRVKGINVKGM